MTAKSRYLQFLILLLSSVLISASIAVAAQETRMVTGLRGEKVRSPASVYGVDARTAKQLRSVQLLDWTTESNF